MAMAFRPPRALIKVIVAASSNEMQSHSTLPSGVQNQQRALPDGERRLRADADQAGLVLAKGIEVADREPFQSRPCLSAGRHELPFLLADHTLLRRALARRVWSAARRADVRACIEPLPIAED